MGLFSKKHKEPVQHAPVERTVFVRASEAAVSARLAEYSALSSPKHTPESELDVARSGDWIAVRLPLEVHPWQLHNLAFWMLDCAGDAVDVIAQSAGGPDHAGYRLVRDPELPDALCGWDDDGNGWTVRVPGNDIVRSEPVPVSQTLSCPDGFEPGNTVAVRLEDPGADMNPTNQSNAKSRKHLERIDDVGSW